MAALAISSMFFAVLAFAADSIKGQVLGGGAPIVQSTVTLFAASADAPRQLAQTKTDNEGRFEVRSTGAPADSSLYLLAMGGEPRGKGGDNPAIALLTVVGSKPPAHVVINEMTTVASVWTHAQFIDGATIKGHALGLRIAAGNVPNFVNLETGGWGGAIQDPLNSGQTPTMANFASLADLLSACVTRVKANACGGVEGGSQRNHALCAQQARAGPMSHNAAQRGGTSNGPSRIAADGSDTQPRSDRRTCQLHKRRR